MSEELIINSPPVIFTPRVPFIPFVDARPTGCVLPPPVMMLKSPPLMVIVLVAEKPSPDDITLNVPPSISTIPLVADESLSDFIASPPQLTVMFPS